MQAVKTCETWLFMTVSCFPNAACVPLRALVIQSSCIFSLASSYHFLKIVKWAADQWGLDDVSVCVGTIEHPFLDWLASPLLTTFHTRPPRPACRKPRSWEHMATKRAGGIDGGVQRKREREIWVTGPSQTEWNCDPDCNSVCVCVHLGHMIQTVGRWLQAYMSCDSSLLSHVGMFIQPAPFSNPCMHSSLSNTIHGLTQLLAPWGGFVWVLVWCKLCEILIWRWWFSVLQTPETPC